MEDVKMKLKISRRGETQRGLPKGFTLIELLVVVLIIGILAAVAVPQYQKAVKKTRLTKWITTVNALTKAADVWLLEYGWQEEPLYFLGNKTGNYNFGELDIDIPWEKHESAQNSLNKIGSWNFSCYKPSTNYVCDLCVNTTKSTWKKDWLGSSRTLCVRKWSHIPEKGWRLGQLDGAQDEDAKLVCQLWVQNFGTQRMSTSIAEKCVALGVQ